MKRSGYIYKITCTITNKIYIGQTRRSVSERWYQHCHYSQNSQQYKSKLYSAINKYGKENFIIETLWEGNYEENELLERLNKLERDFIDLYYAVDYGYNILPGGNCNFPLDRIYKTKTQIRGFTKYVSIPRSIDWSTMRECCPLVYATLRWHMDFKTRRCFPSQKHIQEITKLSKREVNECISELASNNLIEKWLENNHCVYYINYAKDEKLYDRFSEAFLSSPIPPKTKCFYIKLQRYLFINKEEQEVFLRLSIRKIAEKLQCSTTTAQKHLKILKEAGILYTSDKGTLVNVTKLGQEFLLMKAEIQKLKDENAWMAKKLSQHETTINILWQEREKAKQEAEKGPSTFAL